MQVIAQIGHLDLWIILAPHALDVPPSIWTAEVGDEPGMHIDLRFAGQPFTAFTGIKQDRNGILNGCKRRTKGYNLRPGLKTGQH